METELMHDLVAGYALDALTPEEERSFEAHLAGCSRCQEELAGFTTLAASLAFAAPESKPSPRVRGRLLAVAHNDRAQVVPLRPRWAYAAVAIAAAAACLAVGLGVWGATRPGTQPSALRTLSLRGAAGTVVVTGDHHATLVVSGLPAAPSGKTYEIWVMRKNAAAPAGLFSAKSQTATVRLARPLPSGSFVGVTLEPAGGSARPTAAPLVTSNHA
jgi:anti-sigma-K factor RskA